MRIQGRLYRDGFYEGSPLIIELSAPNEEGHTRVPLTYALKELLNKQVEICAREAGEVDC